MAITLLILDVRVPIVQTELLQSLLKQWPTYLGYMTSFLVITIFWANHHNMFRHILKRRIESVLSDASEGVITGFGVSGYLLALDAILHLLNQKANAQEAGSGVNEQARESRSA